MLEAAVVACRRLHLDPDIWLVLLVDIIELRKLNFFFVSYRMDKRLVQIEDQQAIEALLFELELYLGCGAYGRELLYFLGSTDGLDDRH